MCHTRNVVKLMVNVNGDCQFRQLKEESSKPKLESIETNHVKIGLLLCTDWLIDQNQ